MPATQIKQEWIETLILDPVMAAYVIMGAELDVFQQARLRTMWFVPIVVDSSGISTGKTITEFVFVNLRCILLPDHVAGIYFPNFQTAKDEYWPYFDIYLEKSELFRKQFVYHHNKVGEHKFPGAWVMDYKNRSKFVMPAPSFMTDSQTQASRRFNTLVVDDWLRAEDMGEGISRQLVDRTTRACFNKNHPIWCNHQVFLGHAERPSHKGYVRVKGYKRAIQDGSHRHALVTFDYRDWTPQFAKKYREDNVIADQKRVLPEDQFRRQYHGVWSRDGTAYYPEIVLARNCRREVTPCFGRVYPNEINILGFDIAQSLSHRADYTSAVNYRLVELTRELEAEIARRRSVAGSRKSDNGNAKAVDALVPMPRHNLTHEGRRFNASFPFAHRLRNQDVVAISGLVHFLHLVFGYSRIILDPRGGGLFLYGQLQKEQQMINGALKRVVGLCTRQEMVQADKHAIVSFFQRGGDLDQVILPQFLKAEEGFLEAMHQRYREAWEASEIDWPLAIEDRSPIEVKAWSTEQLWAQRLLDAGLKELQGVRQLTDKNSEPLTSHRGFKMFEGKGKKDVAYASLYAYSGGRLWLHEHATSQDDEEEGVIL